MTILVAIGDDDRFTAVLEVAAQFARDTSQDLTIAHLIANENASGSDRSLRDEVRSVLSEADVDVEVTLEHLNRSGLRSSKATGKHLVDIAEDVEIDHIIIGYRSKARLAELRDGHTGFVVAQEASVPVTIVPERVEP
ncbi:MAG: universal stress protein [Halobellus sp.]|uniref:universal stress protein n=1 Tax=Halobellus sp. TaxID=1979212 RepID=UPI0035D46FEF